MAPIEQNPQARPRGGQILDPKFEHSNPHVVSAYGICRDKGEKPLLRQLEEAGSDDDVKGLKRKLKNVRVLAYLLCYAPTDTAISHICTVIFTINGLPSEDILDKLVQTGFFYDMFFIQQCKLLCSSILYMS